MSVLLGLPFVLQGFLHFFDEYYYHRRRAPLPNWELWSHPFDTFWVLVVGALCWRGPLSLWSLVAYLILFVISCLSVTKDEWVHSQECVPGEQWLHAMLFVMHPLILLAMGLFGLSRFHQELEAPWLVVFSEAFYWLPVFTLACFGVLLAQTTMGVWQWKKN